MEELTLITFQINDQVILPHYITGSRCFMIHKANYLFLCHNGYEIMKWSTITKDVEIISLDQEYQLMYYDDMEGCYWAISVSRPHVIQQLDCTFCCVCEIAISDPSWQKPIALYCDDCRKGIVVNYLCETAVVGIKDKKTTWFKHELHNKTVSAYLYQCDYRVDAYQEYKHQIMQIVVCSTKKQFAISIPTNYKIVAMLPCCSEKSGLNCFCVLYFNLCSKTLVVINYCISASDKPLNPPHPIAKHCSFDEIIHSIALEEVGISHILHAEGDKIQKAIALSKNVEELICVNESVKRTLTQLTLFEGMLYSKLETIVSSDEFSSSHKGCLPCAPLCNHDDNIKE